VIPPAVADVNARRAKHSPRRVFFGQLLVFAREAEHLGAFGLTVLFEPVGGHQARRVVGVGNNLGEEGFFQRRETLVRVRSGRC
jgi:hypothetical protein